MCGYIGVGEVVLTNIMNKSACAANEMEGLTCACVRAGDQKPHPFVSDSHCCSGETENDGLTCACKGNGQTLVSGATATDCCSNRAGSSSGDSIQHCLCGLPGSPSLEDGSHCCAHHAVGGYCGCHSHGTEVTAHGRHCCGQLVEPDQEHCRCIPTGWQVPPYARDVSCCNGTIVGGVCQYVAAAAATVVPAPAAASDTTPSPTPTTQCTNSNAPASGNKKYEWTEFCSDQQPVHFECMGGASTYSLNGTLRSEHGTWTVNYADNTRDDNKIAINCRKKVADLGNAALFDYGGNDVGAIEWHDKTAAGGTILCCNNEGTQSIHEHHGQQTRSKCKGTALTYTCGAGNNN